MLTGTHTDTQSDRNKPLAEFNKHRGCSKATKKRTLYVRDFMSIWRKGSYKSLVNAARTADKSQRGILSFLGKQQTLLHLMGINLLLMTPVRIGPPIGVMHISHRLSLTSTDGARSCLKNLKTQKLLLFAVSPRVLLPLGIEHKIRLSYMTGSDIEGLPVGSRPEGAIPSSDTKEELQ